MLGFLVPDPFPLALSESAVLADRLMRCKVITLWDVEGEKRRSRRNI